MSKNGQSLDGVRNRIAKGLANRYHDLLSGTRSSEKRRAKVNWVRGHGTVGVSLQRQLVHQMQQQQQSQTQQIQIRRRDPRIIKQADGSLNLEELSQEPLINRQNLVAVLGKYAKTEFSMNEEDLLQFWDNLVGKVADHIANPEFKITHMTPKALRALLPYRNLLQDGLILNNMPDGFFMHFQVESNRHILAFDPEVVHPDNPFKLKLTQCCVPNLEIQEDLQSLLEFLYQPLSENLRSAVSAWPNCNDTQHLEIIQALYPEKHSIQEAIQQARMSFESAISLLVQGHSVTLELALGLAQKLKQKGLYESLLTTFYPQGIPFSALKNHEVVDNLLALCRLKDDELAWWLHLTSLQAKPCDFNSQFITFRNFIAETRSQRLKLPLPCPIHTCKNLQVTLGRVNELLNQASDKQMQLSLLEGIDFSAQGAWYAAYHQTYHLVSAEMKLSVDKAVTYVNEPPYSPQKFLETVNGCDYATAKMHFFRYLGQEQKIYPFTVYQKTVKDLEELPYSEALKVQALAIIALTTTGKNINLDKEMNPLELLTGIIRELDKDIHLQNEAESIKQADFTKILKELNQTLVDKIPYNIPNLEQLAAVTTNFCPPAPEVALVIATRPPTDIRRINFPEEYDHTYVLYQNPETQKIEITFASRDKEPGVLQKVALDSLTTTQTQVLQKLYQGGGQVPIEKVAYNFLSGISEKVISVQDKYKKIIDWLKEMGDDVYPILDRLSERANPPGKTLLVGEEKARKAVSFGFLMQMVDIVDEVLQDLSQSKKEENEQSMQFMQCLAENRSLLKSRLIHLLLLTSDDLKSHSDKEIKKFKETVSCLAEALTKGLSNSSGGYDADVFNTLISINVPASFELPKANQIICSIEKLYSMGSQIGERPKDQQRMMLYKAYVAQLNPTHVVVNPPEVATRMPNSLSLMKEVLIDSKIIDALQKVQQILREKLTDIKVTKNQSMQTKLLVKALPVDPVKMVEDVLAKLKPYLDEFNRLVEALSLATQNTDELIDKINEAEIKLKELLEFFTSQSRVVRLALAIFENQIALRCGQILGIGQDDAKKLIFDQELQVVLGPALIRKMESYYQQQFRAMNNTPLDLWIRHQFPVWALRDKKKKTKDTLRKLLESYEKIGSTLNCLLTLKDTYQKSDYDQILKNLNNNNLLQHFNLDSMTALLTILSIKTNLSPAKQIQILATALLNETAPKHDRLLQALQDIQMLAQVGNSLPEEPYQKLLSISLSYNLKHPKPLPLLPLIQLMQDAGDFQNKAHTFTATLLQVLSSTPAERLDEAYSSQLEQTFVSIQKIAKSSPVVIDALLIMIRKDDQTIDSNLDDLNCELEILEKFDAKSRELLCQIIARLAVSMETFDRPILFEIQRLLIEKADLIPHLANMFSHEPYPSSAFLLQVLRGELGDMDKVVELYDLDPYNQRAGDRAKKLAQQFDDSNLIRVASEVKDMLNDTLLPSDQQYELAQQVCYIQMLGQHYPQMDPAGETLDLTTCTRAKLGEISKDLIKTIRDPLLLKDDRVKLRLRLLAVMREQYFRATGRFPDTTQILTVLLSMENQQNILLNMETGQGKSVLTALLAAMMWAESGKSINVCTDTKLLVEQDYQLKNNKLFFKQIGANSVKVYAESASATYAHGGINYTTLGDLALYRARAKHEAETDFDKITDAHLILDESDKAILYDKTQFNYATSPREGDGRTNPFAWAYPLILDFIDQEAFKSIDEVEGWTPREDVQKLVMYFQTLSEETPSSMTPLQWKQFNNLPQDRLQLWLNAACVASSLQEGRDFVIHTHRDPLRKVAVPLNRDVPQLGSTFSHSVQQMLHARLAREDIGASGLYPIDPEMAFIDSISSRDMIRLHQGKGRILGLSGTIGAPVELLLQKKDFNFLPFFISPHLISQRKKLPKRFVSDQQMLPFLRKLFKNLTDQLGSGNTPPVLLFVKDLPEAEDLQRAFQGLIVAGHPVTTKILTGESSENGSSQDLVRQFDYEIQPNTIALTTLAGARGIDYKAPADEPLVVINVVESIESDLIQKFGRTGRRGAKGLCIEIYRDNLGFLKGRLLPALQSKKYPTREKRLEAVIHAMNLSSATERHYLQTLSSIKQIILDRFDDWSGLQIRYSPAAELIALRQELNKKREMILDKMDELWQVHLSASDPENHYANPYIRINASGQNDTQALDTALGDYINALCDEWQLLQNDFAQTLSESIPVEPEHVDRLRFNYLTQEYDLKKAMVFQRVTMDTDFTEPSYADTRPTQRVRLANNPVEAELTYGITHDEQKRKALEARNRILKCERIHNLYIELLSDSRLNKKYQYHITGELTLEALVGKMSQLKDFAETKGETALLRGLYPLLSEAYALDAEKYAEVIEQVNQWQRKQLAKELLNQLDWARPGKYSKLRHITYYLERRSSKKAARELLSLAQALQQQPQDSVALGSLYTALIKHQRLLSHKQQFAIGHQNLRKTVGQCLNRLVSVVNLNESQLLLAKEQGLRAYGLEKVKLDNPAKLKFLTRAQQAEIQDILNKNPHFFVLDELLCYLNSQGGLKVQELAANLRRILGNIEKEHPQARQESCFIKDQQEALQAMNPDTTVQLVAGHDGLRPFIDMVVKTKEPNDPQWAGFNEDPAQLQRKYQTLLELAESLQGLKNDPHSKKQYATLASEITQASSLLGEIGTRQWVLTNHPLLCSEEAALNRWRSNPESEPELDSKLKGIAEIKNAYATYEKSRKSKKSEVKSKALKGLNEAVNVVIQSLRDELATLETRVAEIRSTREQLDKKLNVLSSSEESLMEKFREHSNRKTESILKRRFYNPKELLDLKNQAQERDVSLGRAAM